MKKILYGLLSITLAAALIITVGVGSSWFTNWQIKTWFNSWGQQKPLPPDDENLEENSGSSFFVNTDYEASNGLSLRATSYSLSSETFTLRVIKTPTDADASAYDWTVTFANATTGWGAGKNATDYVTVTPSSEDGAEVVVTCLQPFSAEIRITVFLSENPKVYGYATCNYGKKVTNVKYEIPNQLTLSNGAAATWTWAPSMDIENDIQNWAEKRGSVSVEWSDGTLDSNVEDFQFSVSCSEQLKAQLDKISMSEVERSAYRKTLSYNDERYISFSQGALFFAGGNEPYGLFSFCGEAFDYQVDNLNTTNFKALRTALQACSVDFVITVKVTPTYCNDYIATYNVNVDNASIRLLASSITIDKPSIIF